MSAYLTRGTLLTVAAVLAACGTTTTTTTGGGGGSQTATPSPSGSAAASGAAAGLALTVDALPPSSAAGPLTQFSDGLLTGTPGTDQRVFSNGDHTFAIEIDLIAGGSTSAATATYPSVRDAAKGRITTLANASMPSLGGQSDQFEGTASNGASLVAITFLEGVYAVAVLVESKGGAVDPGYALQVATAQDSRIKSG
jgi:hypothetical protein